MFSCIVVKLMLHFREFYFEFLEWDNFPSQVLMVMKVRYKSSEHLW